MLVAHLLVDAVDRLLAAGDFGVDLRVRHRALHRLEDLADHFAAIASRGLHRLFERRVAMRIEVREAHVLQLAIRIVQAEAVRDRRIDVERLARDAAALLHRHRAERAHVVQAVGKLHEDHAHVARHREQHLAEILRLRLLAAPEFHLVEFRQAVDELGDLRAEALGELALRHALVFHHVVQERGHDRLRVELPAGADLRDGYRMGDVGLAALAILTEVGLVAEVERGLDLFDFLGTEVIGKRGGQLRDGNDAVLAGLLGCRGRPEQMTKRLFENRVDILTRVRRCGGFGVPGLRGGGRWCSAHFRLLGSLVGRAGVYMAEETGCALNGHFLQHFHADLAGRDLAQRDDRRLVAAFDLRRVALRKLPRAIGGGERQFEAVRNLLQAVFNGNASHVGSFLLNMLLILPYVPRSPPSLRMRQMNAELDE